MPGWTTLYALVREELQQSREEGKDAAAISEIEERWRNLADDAPQLAALHSELLALPVGPDFPFQEPSDLAGIRSSRSGESRTWSLDCTDEELHDRMYGAWLGRCVGCALGKPVELFMHEKKGLPSWLRQKKYLTAVGADEWPLRDYFPAHSPASSETGAVICPASTRDQIGFMETDDDIRYTVLGQCIMRDYGADFTSSHVAHTWLQKLSYGDVCTAETQAYRNMVLDWGELSQEPAAGSDDAIDWYWISHHLNPYREWIGAQIRVDSYGYAAPGNPALAAELAWRDARISHVKNGIYGAMLFAAMIAAAFTSDNASEIVETGLAEIPSTSRLHREMHQVIEICNRHGCDFDKFEMVIEEIYELLGHYNAVHTNNNAALCVAALLLSSGDFEKGITLAVMGGWDTDCNGATVGSIVGAMTGARNAPVHWTGRLNDTLMSKIAGYHPIAISECARRSVEVANSISQSTRAA